MKNTFRALSVLGLFLLGSFSNVDTTKHRVRKVVIDAGHGGPDLGARGKFSKEKDIALQITLELGKLIQQHMKDVEVIYTREQDRFVTLHERAKIANKNNADAFISIHCNADSGSSTACGTEIYTMGLHTSEYNLRIAKRENAAILMEKDYQQNYRGFDPQSPESHILLALCQNTHNENSLKLAQSIKQKLKKPEDQKNRGIKQAGFLVLWKTTAPSVLVEVGFITHPQEEKYLNSKAGQHRLASDIFKALRSYKEQLESST